MWETISLKLKKEHYKETFNFDKKGNIKTHEYSVVGHVDCILEFINLINT